MLSTHQTSQEQKFDASKFQIWPGGSCETDMFVRYLINISIES